MAHTVQLGAGSFLKAICPNPSKFRNRDLTEDDIAFVEGEDEDKNDTDDNSDDGQDGDAEFEDKDNKSLDDTEYEVEIDDGIEFNPGNTLGKLLACITQVQVHSYSHKCWKTDSIN